ncbi:MAG: ornithine aminotransferase [Alphaproteobacteria bacterium 64-11]|nr:BON domain-containing protein [Alphaproteobacteria bacterium]OJU12608.1 MAG: ornithine aminotransferase [Alphaproteobacteria bacterium 64-11]
MDDKSLQQSIIDELDFDPSINAAHIGVAVDRGIVTLSGHVHSYMEKLSVEAAVRRVKGVRGIAADISVRHPSDKKIADDEIAKRAVDILNWSIHVPADSIQVTVENGWVTLAGDVDWQYQKIGAADAVQGLSGVAGVTNNIVIRPRVPPGSAEPEIMEALRRQAATDPCQVRVVLHDGGRISLYGSVPNWHEWDAAEQAAWSIPGVTSVDNKLTIG